MKLKKSQSVYVILNPQIGILKIGIASDIRKRFKALRGACGCELELVYYSEPIQNARIIESEAHGYFEKERGIGEWFSVDSNVVVDYLMSRRFKFEFDEVYLKYKSGIPIKTIASQYHVSRAAILSRLKGALMYLEVDKKESDTPKVNEFEIVPNLSKYTRVGKNRYKDKAGKECIITFKDGVLLKSKNT